jgi:hypothetical protein
MTDLETRQRSEVRGDQPSLAREGAELRPDERKRSRQLVEYLAEIALGVRKRHRGVS